MSARLAVLASFAVTALLGGAGPAHAVVGDSATCVFEGLMGPGADPYSVNADATCVGNVGATVFGPGPALPQNFSFTSNGRSGGDPCVAAVLGDLSGANTVLSAKPGTLGAPLSIANVGYTIQSIGGIGQIALAGGGFVGEGAVRFTRGLGCAPGTGALQVAGAFTLIGV